MLDLLHRLPRPLARELLAYLTLNARDISRAFVGGSPGAADVAGEGPRRLYPSARPPRSAPATQPDAAGGRA